MNVTRRTVMQWLAAFSACRAGAQESAKAEKAASSDPSEVVHTINAPGLSLGLSNDGHIVRMKLGSKAVSVPFHACTVLAGCDAGSKVTSRALPGNGIQFQREYAKAHTRDRCTVVERFLPTASSIRWEMEVLGAAGPWTTPIETQLAWLNGSTASFWTAWDSPIGSRTGSGESEIPEANPREARDLWMDPLVPHRFVDRNFRYGGLGAEGDAFSIPIATILDDAAGIALSLVQSPEDILLDCSLATTVFGDVILSRTNHRISSSRSIKFGMDLIAHPADWRAGLGWMVNRYPRYFESPNPSARNLDGCGAYSAFEGKLDIDRLHKIAFSVNWNAHFDFPFLGMSIPPVTKGVEWKSWYQKTTSLDKMEQYDKAMRRAGFNVLEYFVITECGNYIQEEPPPRETEVDSERWRHANDFVHGQIPSAVLRDREGKIHYSNWFKNVVVDPADPAWQNSLLDQARTLVKELPDSNGVCIDRMDWLRLYNPNGDDGESWIDGRPARSLINSWKETTAKLSAILHPAGKVMYGNTLIRRLDTTAALDGFYDEYGDHPKMLNMTALMAVHKPAIGWTRTINTLRPNPDALFQRHLHLGVFPTIPFPQADHTIVQDPWVDEYYTDYGPLLSAIKGKRWVLEPNAISLESGEASINLFEVPDGFAIPITFGRTNEVTVLLRTGELIRKELVHLQAIYPGGGQPITLQTETKGDYLQFRVPLQRHCALVLVHSDGGIHSAASLKHG